MDLVDLHAAYDFSGRTFVITGAEWCRLPARCRINVRVSQINYTISDRAQRARPLTQSQSTRVKP